jgi:hypothetical protein
MSNRQLDRERWEVLITTILLSYRPFIFMGACILLVAAGAAWFSFPEMAILSTGLAVFLFGMVFSDRVTLHIARLAAWLLTLTNIQSK